MSWVERIQNDLIITTGDGKKYRPSWLNAQKGVEFNIAEFTFPGLAGSLVKKSKPKGRRFSLEIYFQGENHLDTARAFEISANDERPWTLEHPLYDILIVHPESLNFDNSEMNVSKITGSLIETIVEDAPKSISDPVDAVKLAKSNLDTTFEQSFTETPSSADVNSMLATNTKNKVLGVKIITLPDEAANYFNLFNEANTTISTAIASPLLAIRAITAMINAPALFTASVKSRVTTLSDQFTLLQTTIAGATTPSAKQLYQVQGGALMSSMALAAVTPQDGNYTNRTSVLDIISVLVSVYARYVEGLDALQTDDGGGPDSFIPDAAAQIALNSLVDLAVSNLFDIALGARQERTIYTENDTNIILLTHRFYGLDAEDANIDEMILNNNIGLSELLQIRKGRKIIYYI